jgi:CheY-like chemotaxis protein
MAFFGGFPLAHRSQYPCVMSSRSQIVIASPHGAERETLATWLHSEGFEPVKTASAPAAIEALRARPFDLFISDYDFALMSEVYAAARGRARNPQTPIVMIGEENAAAQTRAESRGASYLVRPVDRTNLVCIVSMALADDRPVRRSIRRAVRFEAAADGTPCHLLDVSNEGLRLELPRSRRSLLPYFNVRVPMIGTTMIVQRVWIAAVRVAGTASDAICCGATLVNNNARIERAWRQFVDAIPARPSDSLRVQY